MVTFAWISMACSVADPPVSTPPDNVDRVVHEHYRKWYRDADGDGHGDPDVWRRGSLTRPPGHVANATDCDDHAATAYPGAEEICGNGHDDDCDSDVDECGIDSGDAELRVEGETENSAFGYEPLAVSDVDGDGVADLLMPAWGGAGNGSVYVLYGPASGVRAVSSLVTLSTTDPTAFFGLGLDGGDVNSDGVNDIAVGAIYVDAAYVFLGPITGDRDASDADAVLEGAAATSTGGTVDVVEDFDGDGGADLVVGASATVYVASGATSGTVDLATAATHVYEGDASLGPTNVRLGDTNGDGITDLAMAAITYGAEDEGAVYVVEGGAPPGTYDVDASATATLYGRPNSRSPEYFGSGLAAADYDADGTTDLVVGAFRTPLPGAIWAGAVYAFLGPLSGTLHTRDAAVTWTGSTDVEALGLDISAGDVDGDESVDVLMGAMWTPSSSSPHGAAFLQFGLASGSVDVNNLLAVRGHASEELGTSTALVPDWTGDGGDEVALGARSWRDTAGDYVGAVYVVFSDQLHF